MAQDALENDALENTGEGARVELRIHGQRAVLVRFVPAEDGAPRGEFTDPGDAGLGENLTSALHEWARVAAAVAGGRTAGDSRVAAMVSHRGRQLAGRVAETVDAPVRYSDPVDGTSVVVRPAMRRGVGSGAESLIGTSPRPGDRVPWLTGLVLALFTGVVLAVAMLALTHALAVQVGGWLAVVAALVVTAGMAPSLWLGRRQLILRWGVLGAAVGIAAAWIGVLTFAL